MKIDLDEDLTRVDGIAHGDANRANRTGSVGMHLVFHFHGFDDEEELTGGHRRANLHEDLDDAAGHGCRRALSPASRGARRGLKRGEGRSLERSDARRHRLTRDVGPPFVGVASGEEHGRRRRAIRGLDAGEIVGDRQNGEDRTVDPDDPRGIPRIPFDVVLAVAHPDSKSLPRSHAEPKGKRLLTRRPIRLLEA